MRHERSDDDRSKLGATEPAEVFAKDFARNRVNPNKVITHWSGMLRVAGSVGPGVRRVRRIAKTLRLLAVVDPIDDTHHQQMNRKLAWCAVPRQARHVSAYA